MFNHLHRDLKFLYALSVQYLSMIIEEDPPLFSGALLLLFIYNQKRASAHVEKDKHISSNEQIVLMKKYQAEGCAPNVKRPPPEAVA